MVHTSKLGQNIRSTGGPDEGLEFLLRALGQAHKSVSREQHGQSPANSGSQKWTNGGQENPCKVNPGKR